MKLEWLSRLRNNGKYLFDLMVSERVKVGALQALPFWAASFITGLVAVGYAKLFSYSEGLLQNVLHWHHWMLFIITPVCFAAALLVVQWLAPNAKGSGIPQVMAAIDLSTPKYQGKVKKLLSIRIAFTKVLSSLLMVLGGGVVGREGPTIQIAGSIFYVIHKIIPKSWPKLSSQNFILTGAAAGLAAAFNTPLGGVVFAMEELAKIHVRFFRTALFSAVIIAGLTAQALIGPYLYLGYPEVRYLQFSIFIGVAITAVIAGMAGSFTCTMIIKVMKWKKDFSKTQSILFVVVAGVLIATIAYFITGSVLGSGKELMVTSLFTSEKYVPWYTVLLRMLGSVLCFNTGAAGGIFAPALSAGATVGAYIAGLFHVMGANANILILCGMVGFLTGVTRTPFTSAILVLEMTDRHSVIFHLMVAALLANMAALIIDKHSFYEQLKKGYEKELIEENNEEENNELQPAIL